MQKIQVLSRQSLFDIAIQYTGNVLNAFEIALANNIAVTDALFVSQELVIPDSVSISKKEVNYLIGQVIIPATAITLDQESVYVPGQGIGSMIIESTFIVV